MKRQLFEDPISFRKKQRVTELAGKTQDVHQSANSSTALTTTCVSNAEPVTGITPFQRALEQRCLHLAASDRLAFLEAFEKIKQDDLMAKIQEYDNAHKSKSRFRPRTQAVSKFLNLLQQFMSGVTIAIQANPTPCALIVGAAQLVLLSALNIVTFFDRLSDMTARLSDYLGPLAEYAKSVGSSDLLQRELADVYGDLLQFWVSAVRIFLDEKGQKKKYISLRTALRVQWDPFEMTFGEIEKRFQHHLKVLEVGSSAVQFGTVAKVEEEKRIEERETFLNWISDDDFERIHDEKYSKKHPGTGEWLIQTGAFQSWLADSEGKLLWCYGKPGAGKSILLSNVVECLTSQYGTHKDIGICFVYYDYKKPELGDPSKVVAALIKQLCRKKDSIPPNLLQFKRDALRPSFESLQEIFVSLAGTFNDIYLLVDALDECPSDQRHEMIGFLDKISTSLPSAKVFVTSRKEGDIVEAFDNSNITVIKVEAHHVAEDIESFVRVEVKRLRQGYNGKRLYLNCDSLEEKIIQSLSERADGMFLWVQLQLECLCITSKSRNNNDIEDALRRMPKSLDETYSRIVHQIDAQPDNMKELAFKTFAWVFHAEELLSCDELLIALGTLGPIRDEEDLRESSKDAILEACANLVEDDGYFIRPAHFSIQEFFTHKSSNMPQESSLELLSDMEAVHTMLARACLYHFENAGLKTGPSPDHLSFVHRREQNPFLWYSIKFFDRHIEHLQDIPEDIYQLLETIFSRPKEYLQAVLQVRLDNDRTKHELEFAFSRSVDASTIFYNTRLWNIPKLRSRFHQFGIPRNALHHACSMGSIDTVSYLLDSGCDIDDFDESGRTPIHYAIMYGHDNIVSTLIRSGADVFRPAFNYGSNLQLAAVFGTTETMKKLLYAGVHVNDWGGIYHTALQGAAASRYFPLEKVSLLIQAGADVNEVGGQEYGTALHAAALSSHNSIEMISMLLDAGADVNISGGNEYGTVLQAAAESRSNSLSKLTLLIQAGSNVNALEGEYGTALQAAAASGSKSFEKMEILLEAGAQVNLVGGYYGTALQASAALPIDGLDKVDLLLRAGADVNIVGGFYGTALQAAAASSRAPGSEIIVRRLLAAGADMNIVAGARSTALHGAAWLGKRDIVQLLLENGASTSIEAGPHGSVVYAAVSGPITAAPSGPSLGDVKEVLRLLYRAGASVKRDEPNERLRKLTDEIMREGLGGNLPESPIVVSREERNSHQD